MSHCSFFTICSKVFFFFLTNTIAAISPQFHDESKWQVPFNLVELKQREYKDFVPCLPEIYFWTWKQNWAGGNSSTHLWLHMRLLEAGGFGVRFGNRRHTWKYVFLRNSQAKVDYRTNKKKIPYALPCLWVAGKEEFLLILPTLLCVCVFGCWTGEQPATFCLWGLPVALPHSLEKLRILESMEGLKSHRHHLPSNPSGADVVLITTFLLLDSFRPFKWEQIIGIW